MQLEKVFELEDISRNSGSSDRYAYSAFVFYKIIICSRMIQYYWDFVTANTGQKIINKCQSGWKKYKSRMRELLISIVLSVCGFCPGLPLIQNGGGLAI